MADDFDPTVLDEAETQEPAVDPNEAAAELAAAEAEAEAVAAEAEEIAAAELAEAKEAAAEAEPREEMELGGALIQEVPPGVKGQHVPLPDESIDDELAPEATDEAAWELARVPAQSRVPGANPLDTVPAQSRINTDGSEIAR